MIPAIVQSGGGVTVLGGGIAAESALRAALAVAPILVAADGGALRALELGLMPEAVIGDMDSAGDLSGRVPAARIHAVAEQDSTDFEKCLARVSAPFVIGVGMTGRRGDHQIAALNTVVRYPRPVILLDESDACFHAPARLRMDLPAGTRVSLFALRPWRGRSRGLRWPLDGLTLAPDGRSGTSNEALGGPVIVEEESPERGPDYGRERGPGPAGGAATGSATAAGEGRGLMVWVPAAALPQVLQAVTQARVPAQRHRSRNRQ